MPKEAENTGVNEDLFFVGREFEIGNALGIVRRFGERNTAAGVLFFTGCAGSGKTTLVREIDKRLEGQKRNHVLVDFVDEDKEAVERMDADKLLVVEKIIYGMEKGETREKALEMLTEAKVITKDYSSEEKADWANRLFEEIVSMESGRGKKLVLGICGLDNLTQKTREWIFEGMAGNAIVSRDLLIIAEGSAGVYMKPPVRRRLETVRIGNLDKKAAQEIFTDKEVFEEVYNLTAGHVGMLGFAADIVKKWRIAGVEYSLGKLAGEIKRQYIDGVILDGLGVEAAGKSLIGVAGVGRSFGPRSLQDNLKIFGVELGGDFRWIMRVGNIFHDAGITLRGMTFNDNSLALAYRQVLQLWMKTEYPEQWLECHRAAISRIESQPTSDTRCLSAEVARECWYLEMQLPVQERKTFAQRKQWLVDGGKTDMSKLVKHQPEEYYNYLFYLGLGWDDDKELTDLLGVAEAKDVAEAIRIRKLEVMKRLDEMNE